MSRQITIWQGADKTINVTHDYTDLPSATEVEVFIGNTDDPEITKDLSTGISGVTATAFVLTLDSTDSTDVSPGEYEIQARITTASGGVLFGRIQPSTVTIRPTVFSS